MNCTHDLKELTIEDLVGNVEYKPEYLHCAKCGILLHAKTKEIVGPAYGGDL